MVSSSSTVAPSPDGQSLGTARGRSFRGRRIKALGYARPRPSRPWPREDGSARSAGTFLSVEERGYISRELGRGDKAVAQVGVHDQPPVGHSVGRLSEHLQGPEAILRAVDHQCLGLDSWQAAADIEAILSFVLAMVSVGFLTLIQRDASRNGGLRAALSQRRCTSPSRSASAANRPVVSKIRNVLSCARRATGPTCRPRWRLPLAERPADGRRSAASQ